MYGSIHALKKKKKNRREDAMLHDWNFRNCFALSLHSQETQHKKHTEKNTLPKLPCLAPGSSTKERQRYYCTILSSLDQSSADLQDRKRASTSLTRTCRCLGLRPTPTFEIPTDSCQTRRLLALHWCCCRRRIHRWYQEYLLLQARILLTPRGLPVVVTDIPFLEEARLLFHLLEQNGSVRIRLPMRTPMIRCRLARW